MNPTNELRDTLEALLDGRFICAVSTPDLFRQLRDRGFTKQVNSALTPFGRSLAIVGNEEHPEAFFAGMVNLDLPNDRAHAIRSLTAMRDNIEPCIAFFALLDQAGGNNLSLIVGGDLPFAKLLDAIESHEPYREQLRDLSGLKLFDTTRNAKDTADRLAKVLKIMQEEGYLVKRSNESSVYVFTGKLAYLQQILGWLADHHGLSVEESSPEGQQQGGLGL